MPVLPIRNLGRSGVITDIDPYNLPLDSFTIGVNVRFADGNIERSPIPREVYEWSADLTNQPVFLYPIKKDAQTIDRIVAVFDNFDIREFSNGAIDDAKKYDTGATDIVLNKVTATTLANINYFNRPDRVPLFRSDAGVYSDLTNWPDDTKCLSLRSYGDFLIALNIKIGTTEYSERVMWSDIALANQVPGSWSATDTSTSAGFNDLAPLRSPIVDGGTLGTNFMIYSADQVWQMEFVGGSFIFNFRKIFDDCGVISQDCVVEVGGKHYVFDRNDIYVHDGISRQSICDGRVRDFIFTNINLAKGPECFVIHMQNLEEIYFCYASSDNYTGFDDVGGANPSRGCNRAAVYNYKSDTWSFVDLPNVRHGCLANIGTVSQYETSPLNYDTTGASYASLDSKFQVYPVFVSEQFNDLAITKCRLLGYDRSDASQLALPISTLTKPCVLERTGIDLDDVTSLPLATYKVIRRITPLVSSKSTDQTFKFQFGAANLLAQTPNYGQELSFDPTLSYKMITEDLKDFKFSGMDFDVVFTGRR